MLKRRSNTLRKTNQQFRQEIADRLRAEKAKQNLERALLQGQKLQAIGTLAGGIAHDFNNLLYAISGYSELIRDELPQGSTIHHNLSKILEAAHRGEDLIGRILAFSRRPHPALKPLDIQYTIDSVLALLAPTIPASVMIRFISKDRHMTLLGNQTELHQVIVNIINNAVDAMDGEGTITITLTEVSKEDPALQAFPNHKQTRYCKIEIHDTGVGMDITTQERIFEPFFTTKAVGKGTGLGLSMVHSILAGHGGEITVASQLGKGTTFTLWLPIDDNPKSSEQTLGAF